MTFGSLFSGIGGIDLGLERAGMECRWQVENEPYCNRVLAKHWPGVKRYGDITQLTGRELEPVDLITGGFPCQDLSQAGKRAGIDGTRSGLWFEFARIVRVLRPRFVLVENVPGLLDWRAISRVCGELARSGYVGSWLCLRASDFGASHLRKRVFIVAHSGSARARERAGFHSDGPSPLAARFGDGIGELAHGSRIAGEGIDPCAGNRGGDSRGESGELAHCSAGGRGELRQPSGRERLTHGRDETLAHTRCAGIGRTTQPADECRARPSIHDCGASGNVGDPAGPRCDSSGACGASGPGAIAGEPDGRSEPLEDSSRHEQPGSQGEGGRMRRGRVRETGEPMADAGDGLISQPRRGSPGRDGVGSAGEMLSIFCREYSVCHNPNQCDGGDSKHYGEFPPGCWLKRNGREYPEGFEPEDQLDHAQRAGLEVGGVEREQPLRPIAAIIAAGLQFAPGPTDPLWPVILRFRPDLAPALAQPVRKRSSPELDREPDQEHTDDQAGASGGSGAKLSEAAESPVRGVADGLPDRMDGTGLDPRFHPTPDTLAWLAAMGEADLAAEEWLKHNAARQIELAMKNRTRRLKALGNSVVPQCAEWIGRRILDWEQEQ